LTLEETANDQAWKEHWADRQAENGEKTPVTARIDLARPEDAEVIAVMVGELLQEIMSAVSEKAFNFHHQDTEARARGWLIDGSYLVLLARHGGAAVGFLALYQSYALYTEGAYGTIPEFYVRPPYRSRGIGTALIEESKKVGQARGWRRLEVTTPPLPQFERTLAFYQRHGFHISGGRKLKVLL
jgi:GNAT superfamily N-acetyltransferase